MRFMLPPSAAAAAPRGGGEGATVLPAILRSPAGPCAIERRAHDAVVELSPVPD
jgi:hypothetical protein